MFYDEYLTELSDTEANRWIWLRSIEWANWPVFISQPLVPIALVLFKWWSVLVALYIMNIVWLRVRYRYFNPYLSTVAARFTKLKWFAAIGLGAFFFFRSEYQLSMLATLWPFLCVGMMLSGNLGRIRSLIAAVIGYSRDETNCGLLDAVRRPETPIKKKTPSWFDSELSYHTLKIYR